LSFLDPREFRADVVVTGAVNREGQSEYERVADANFSTQLAALERMLQASTAVGTILDRLRGLSLPDWYLGAGAITHTVWNDLHGYAATRGIKDYDIVYFDAGDLTSDDGEAHVAEALGALFTDLSVHFDVKNQAQVHLWYERRFGKHEGIAGTVRAPQGSE
jgi:hypothetical protein